MITTESYLKMGYRFGFYTLENIVSEQNQLLILISNHIKSIANNQTSHDLYQLSEFIKNIDVTTETPIDTFKNIQSRIDEWNKLEGLYTYKQRKL